MIPIAINSYFLELEQIQLICAKLLLGTLASILVESVPLNLCELLSQHVRESGGKKT